MNGFYMVFLEGGANPAYKHETKLQALAEAKRLAQLHNRTAYVLCTVESVTFDCFKINSIVPPDSNDLPF